MIARMFFSFLVRDVRQQLSYKLSFLLDVASILFTATTFFFVARLFEGASGALFENYTNGYFGFVLVGIAFANYQSVGLNSFAQSLRQEQYVGTLESVLVTPIRIPMFLAGSALWDFIYASLEVLVYFVVAMAAFALSLGNANVGSAVLALILSLTTFMGLGVLSAAFILKFKKGNPVTWLIASAGELFGGVYFPTSILPSWMQSVSEWVPMTHALAALRQSLLSNASVEAISHHLIFLFIFSLVIWPLGVLAFRLALKSSQQDGTLGHY